MFKSNKISTAVKIAAGLSVATVPVQTVVAEEEQLMDEIVVTGSRIRRADLDSASPITVLEREDMLSSGVTDVGDLLQSMPSMSGSPIGTTTNNGGNGSVQIDLRGMGVGRTLSLINGQRTVDGGDYQTIPSTMIERVEILKDGASAVYGADAVAGVVNIITRQNFEGVEISAQTADWSDSEGSQDAVGMIAGKTFDKGHFVFGAEFVKQQEAYQRDVPWDYFQDSYYIYPEGCENQVASPYDGTSTGGCYPIGSSRIPQSRLSFMNQGTFLIGTAATQPYEVGAMIPHDGRTYNYAPVNYMQTPYERTNVFAEANFEITDNVRFKSELRTNNRTSSQELAPLPFTGGDPMYDGNFEGTPYTGMSENNYYLRRAIDSYNAANGASLAYEPLVNPRRRMIETKRRFEQTIDQYQVLIGLEGEFNDMNWDVYINEGHRNREDRDFGQFSGVRLSNAMGPSMDADGDGQPECYTDVADITTLIVGCVPLNMFGGGEVDAGGSVTTATLTQDMIDYVAVNSVDTYKSIQRSAGASISGSAWELPGGDLGWAAGYSYWKQEFSYTPDSAKLIGALTGNVGAGTDGSLTNNSAFVEVQAPVFDNDSQAVLLKAGWRYDHWDAFESDDTWQIGIEFDVIEDLKLRATGGTIFRAPGVGDLFGGLIDTFPTYSDPCIPAAGAALAPGCAQTGVQLDNQLHALIGGNPNLVPETGDTFTAGLVWTPSFGANDFTVTLDWWSIQLENGISSLGAQFTLDDCYLNNNQASCALITRDDSYAITLLLDGSLNVAEQGAEGVDFEVRWNFDSEFGQWEAALLWAHLNERTKTAKPGDAEQDLSGRYTDPTAEDGGAYAEDKMNLSVKWMWNDLTIGYLGEYISGLDADTFCNCGAGNQADGSYIQDIEDIMFHDLVVNYKAPMGVTLSGGITNFTDEEPPFIEIGFNASTDPATYRQFGRGYYLRAGWEF